MRRIVFVIGALALLLPSAVIGYQPTPTTLQPAIDQSMATIPPVQASQTESIEPVVVTPTPTPKPSPTPTPAPLSNTPDGYMGVEEIQALITKWANHYSVSAETLLRIADCESTFNPSAINPYYSAGGGNPTGLFQYLPQTWADFSEKAGRAGASIYDPDAQSQVTAWAFANGLGHNWECT